MRRTIVMLVAGLLFSTCALAVPIAYDEAVDGELPSDYSSGPTFAFDFGANTVSGEVSVRNVSPWSDYDEFNFTLPAMGSLDSISMDMAALPGGIGTYTRDGFRFLGVEQQIILDVAGLLMFPALLPLLGPGPYHMDEYTKSGGMVNGVVDKTAAYTWTFTVSRTQQGVIPEPATLGLWGLGLALAARRRRRRRAA